MGHPRRKCAGAAPPGEVGQLSGDTCSKCRFAAPSPLKEPRPGTWLGCIGKGIAGAGQAHGGRAVRAKKLAAACDPTRGTPEVPRAPPSTCEHLRPAPPHRANNEFGARNFFRTFRELSSEQFRTDNFLGKICSRPVLQRCATYHVLRKIYGGCRILGPRKTCAGFARGAAPLSVGPSSGSHLGLPSVSDPHEGAIWGTLAESAREPPLLGR